MNKEIVIEIKLPFWKNPQCHIWTQHQRDVLKIYTLLWADDEPGININKLGCIYFPCTRAIYIEKKCINYQALSTQFKSSILKIENSTLVREYIHNSQKWDNTLDFTNLNHFVIDSHEHQLSIIAHEFHTETVNIDKYNQHIYDDLF